MRAFIIEKGIAAPCPYSGPAFRRPLHDPTQLSLPKRMPRKRRRQLARAKTRGRRTARRVDAYELPMPMPMSVKIETMIGHRFARHASVPDRYHPSGYSMAVVAECILYLPQGIMPTDEHARAIDVAMNAIPSPWT